MPSNAAHKPEKEALWQVAGVRERRTAAAEVRALLEEHQRQLARWEGRVARQLEKIVALQRGGRTPTSAATPASAAPFRAASGKTAQGFLNG